MGGDPCGRLSRIIMSQIAAEFPQARDPCGRLSILVTMYGLTLNLFIANLAISYIIVYTIYIARLLTPP